MNNLQGKLAARTLVVQIHLHRVDDGLDYSNSEGPNISKFHPYQDHVGQNILDFLFLINIWIALLNILVKRPTKLV